MDIEDAEAQAQAAAKTIKRLSDIDVDSDCEEFKGSNEESSDIEDYEVSQLCGDMISMPLLTTSLCYRPPTKPFKRR